MRIADRLAAIERFEGGELGGFLLDQIGELEQQSATLHGVHLLPRTGLQRLAGRLHRQVDVGLVGLGHLADGLAGGRVDGGEGLVGRAVHELAADEKRLVLDLRRLHGPGFGSGRGCHAILLR